MYCTLTRDSSTYFNVISRCCFASWSSLPLDTLEAQILATAISELNPKRLGTGDLFLKSCKYTQLTMEVVALEAVDEAYTAFAPPGTRDVAKAEENLLLDMPRHEVEAYINRDFHAQP